MPNEVGHTKTARDTQPADQQSGPLKAEPESPAVLGPGTPSALAWDSRSTWLTRRDPARRHWLTWQFLRWVAGPSAASLLGVAALVPPFVDIHHREDNQISQRFAEAVEQLGSESRTTRLNGVLTLGQMMQEAPEEQPAVLVRLAGYLQIESPVPTPAGNADTDNDATASAEIAPAIDVQAALSVIANRDTHYDEDVVIDLSGTDLRGADLQGAQLRNARLIGARLAHARLDGAALAGANLSAANLNEASLEGADLYHAYLTDADLSKAIAAKANFEEATMLRTELHDTQLAGANLSRAHLYDVDLSMAFFWNDIDGAVNLSGAQFVSADLRGAGLSYTDLSGAWFSYSDLQYACLGYANLNGTDLAEADLRNADLAGADLTNANLQGADLSMATGITSDDLNVAVVDNSTSLPRPGRETLSQCGPWEYGSRN